MSETAPERIWAGPSRKNGWLNGACTDDESTAMLWRLDHEYVRADIHDISQTERHADGEYIGHLQARMEELEAALPQWRDISDLPDAGTVLLYHPGVAAQEDFPGHPYQVSNIEYVRCGNAAKFGFTKWQPLTPPEQQ